jgi:hypothetical protein
VPAVGAPPVHLLSLAQRIICGRGQSPHDRSLLITEFVPTDQPTHSATRASRLKLIAHNHLLIADYTWVWGKGNFNAEDAEGAEERNFEREESKERISEFETLGWDFKFKI